MLSNFTAYQLALELYRECEKVHCPHALKDQLTRASLSICLNLAEGSGKMTTKDQRRFYSIARGSCRETQALIQILNRTELTTLSDRVGALIYRLIRPRATPCDDGKRLFVSWDKQ